MEIRSNSYRVRKQRIEEEELPLINKDAGESPPKTVRIVSVFGAGRYIVTGAVTGKTYEFIGSNALEIDEQDAEVLLAIRKGGCCGNNQPVPIFLTV